METVMDKLVWEMGDALQNEIRMDIYVWEMGDTGLNEDRNGQARV